MNNNEEDLLEKYAKVKTPEVLKPVETQDEEDLLEKYSKKIPPHKKALEKAAPEKTAKEISEMSIGERYKHALLSQAKYRTAASEKATKGILSGVSLGATEHIPELHTPESERDYAFYANELLGESLPFMAIHQALSLPFKAFETLTKFGPKVKKAYDFATGVAASVETGATIYSGKKLIKGDEIELLGLASSGLEVGIIDALFRAVPIAKNWIKSLNNKQQAKLLVEGALPNDLTANQYKFYQDEVIPALRQATENEYTQALENATQKANRKYQQELNNTRAAHESELMAKSQQRQITEQEFKQSQAEYENKVRQLQAEHESEMLSIEKANQEAEAIYQEANKSFEKMKQRQELVSNAIQPKESTIDITGRVRPAGEDIGFRPTREPVRDLSPQDRVGEIFSPNKVTNQSRMGETNVRAIRANDNFDYQEVNEAYDLSDRLNQGVEIIQPNLINELQQTIRDIKSIPHPSPPQKQLLDTCEDVLLKIAEIGPNGNILRFIPVNNRILQEQAKALRYYMDFHFEHGNTRGIFTPTVNALEDAVEMGAEFTGNREAVEASKRARTLYRQWAEAYDNKYIRPFRDTRNQDYIKLFNDNLDPDAFLPIQDVLARSNIGNQISNTNKRALIEKEFRKFFDNPKKINPKELDETFSRVREIITPSEEQAIRQELAASRRGREIQIKKFPKVEKPEVPELKAKKPFIPPKAPKKTIIPEIEEVKIPTKPEFKPSKEMQATSKMMNITPEEAMRLTDTPSGLKKIKSKLSKTDAQKQLFKKIGQQKAKEILYGGKVKFDLTGEQLKNILNKGDNFSLLSEILGEEVVEDLLIHTFEIENRVITPKLLKQLGVKAASLKALALFHIF